MHLVIVLIVAVLVLGPKKLPEVGRSLGSGIRQFKSSIEGHDQVEPPIATSEAEEPEKVKVETP
jgi:sec-independent protein translocase protein TatA